MKLHKAAATLMLGLLLMSGSAKAAENWPQFRGPTGDGISDAKGLPTTWSPTEHVKWKADIHGKGVVLSRCLRQPGLADHRNGRRKRTVGADDRSRNGEDHSRPEAV